MAYDIIRGTHTKRDWSCGAADATSESSGVGRTVGKGLVVGALVGAGFLLWQGLKTTPPPVVKRRPGSQRMYMRMSPSGRMIMSTSPVGF